MNVRVLMLAAAIGASYGLTTSPMAHGGVVEGYVWANDFSYAVGAKVTLISDQNHRRQVSIHQ